MYFEQGGGMANTGDAQVVCGPQGEALAPDWLPYRYSSREQHAGFDRADCIVITAYWQRRGGLALAEARWARDGKDGKVIYTLDHLGNESVPNSPFREAAEAAIAKAQCYHCRHQHYVAGRL